MFFLKKKSLPKNSRAFTVGELIIVVTILVILATIGFFSFEQYTQSARASAIQTDVSSLASAVDTFAVKATQNPRRLVQHNPSLALSGTVASGVILVGGSVDTAGTNYSVGIIAPTFYTALGIDREAAADDQGNAFILAATSPVPYEQGAKVQMFQVAGSIVEGDYSAPFIKWAYTPIISTDLTGLIKWVGGGVVAQGWDVPYLVGNTSGANLAAAATPPPPPPSSNNFTTVWKVGAAGYGNGDNTVAFYLDSAGDYTIDWGDGTIEVLSVQKPEHTYATAGDKTIKVSWIIQRFYTSNGGYNDTIAPGKLLSVVDWWNMAWANFDSMFYTARNLTSLPLTAPNLTNVTNMNSTFFNATEFDQDISSWDVSHVTSMHSTFHGATKFNRPLNSWNMSNVTTISGMFSSASMFNQPLNNWDTHNIVDMGQVFFFSTAFNWDISSWDTSNVTNMNGIFCESQEFDQPLSTWDTSNVTDMRYMFSGASKFNQPINSVTWNTTNVTDMYGMFYRASKFNQPIDTWNTSNVTNMGQMFFAAVEFNQPIDTWNTSNVTNMSDMFNAAWKFNQPISSVTWNTTNVADMTNMFYRATDFNQDLSSWNTTNVTSCSGFNSTTPSWALAKPWFTNCTP